MKIKDKLIHLLGGITKTEYKLTDVFVDRPGIVKVERPLVTVKAGYRHKPFNDPPEDIIHEDLAIKLSEQMLNRGLVKIWKEQIIDGSKVHDGPAVTYALVTVVDPHG